MKIIEFGKENKDVIMMLHGGGLSWWNYRDIARVLSDRYHVLLPVLDGHGDSGYAFSSIENNASRLLSWIDSHCDGEILALCGLSLGGQVALEMLMQRPALCQYAFLESVQIIPSLLTKVLIAPAFSFSYGFIRARWFAKLQFDYLRIPKRLFEEYYNDTCKISKDDLIGFTGASCTFTVRPEITEVTARTRILVGSREQKSLIRSAKKLQNLMSDSKLEVMDGYVHGELSLQHPERYCQMLLELLGKSVTKCVRFCNNATDS